MKTVVIYLTFKVILHQFWVKKIFPWKFNLEYGGIFTKLFMHVSSRNMFPTTRNLQIRVHVYRPRHCCGDWLTFGCFVPMISDHDLVKKVINNHGCFVSMLTFVTMIIEESVCFVSCEPIFFAIIVMWYSQNIYIFFFSSIEQCTWAIISPKEFKSWFTHISFALLYGKT